MRRRQSSPYARLQRDIPSSNSRYIEIDEYRAPQNRRASAPVAGPSRIPMELVPRPAPVPLLVHVDAMEGKEAKVLKKVLAGQVSLTMYGRD